VVVFSAHRGPIEALREKRPEGWEFITGDTSDEARWRIQDAFQAGRLRGIGATIQASGVALTFTRSHFAIFVDRLYNPAQNAQAEDRVCRIGQDRGVVIYNLVSKHPLDEHIDSVLMRRQALITASGLGTEKTR
jgi:SNF2 family DNA or RNA helicase